MTTYLVDGVTPLPNIGELDWGTILNTAINAIDDRFTYSSPNYGLASSVTSSSLTSVGTLTSLNVSGAVTITGNLTVNGSTTTINSTTVTTDDIIITLGGDTAPTGDDNKDRGISYRWHDGAAAKLGFFGFDDSTGKFTFIPDATDTTNVYSGTLGTIDVGAVHINGSQIAASNLSNGVTGSGSVVLASSPSLTTPSLGAATATSVNKVAITTPSTSATLTIADGGTLATSGAHSITLAAGGTTSVTLPASGTLATLAGSESLTNKKLGSLTTDGLVTTSGGDGTLSVTTLGTNVSTFLSTPSSANLAAAVSDETGSGALVFATGPSLSAPKLSSYMTEAFLDSSTTSGSVSFDLKNRNIFYFTTDSTANWSFDFRGDGSTTLDSFLGSVSAGVTRSIEARVAITNGATPYYPTAFTVDSSAATVKWVGGTAPVSGNANSIDLYVFNIIKTGSATFTVLAERVQFA